MINHQMATHQMATDEEQLNELTGTNDMSTHTHTWDVDDCVVFMRFPNLAAKLQTHSHGEELATK